VGSNCQIQETYFYSNRLQMVVAELDHGQESSGK
jgi:hypothetical protein